MTPASLARTLAPPLPTTLRFCARLAIQKPLGAVGVAILFCLLLVGILADGLAPYDLQDVSLRRINRPPSSEHWLGTDRLGRDQLTKLIYAARTTLVVGPGVVALSGLVATTLGLLTGYWGGRVDGVLQRVVDTWMSFPDMVILITGALVFGPGMLSVTLTIFVLAVVSITRVTRSAVVREKEALYVEAATAMGASHVRIMLRHLLPNVMGSIFVVSALSVSHAVILEAAATYLGLGLLSSDPSFGQMIRGAGTRIIVPGLCLSAIVFGFNTVADALIDLTNPRSATVVRRSD